MLGSPWEGGRCPDRDRAIVYLLATYGVRRAQVSALRLEDIDWIERTIVFAAHKGGKAVQHVLTDAVAESLADYLRNERPRSDRPRMPIWGKQIEADSCDNYLDIHRPRLGGLGAGRGGAEPAKLSTQRPPARPE